MTFNACAGNNRLVVYAKSFYGCAAYSEYLSKHLESADYYDKERKIEGQWIGEACGDFGVLGTVTNEAFDALQNNRNASTGAKLTQRTKSTRREWVVETLKSGKQRLVKRNVPNRRSFYDLTMSAPKSFSILAITGSADTVLIWHDEAVKKTFAEIEAFTSRKNSKGKKCRLEVTGNLCAARYDHDSNRLLEPQLHSHCVVMNATKGSDGLNYAIESRAWMDRMPYFTNVYWNELAAQAAAHGLETYRDKSGAPQIRGLEDMLPIFSVRSQELERLVDYAEELAGSRLSNAERKRIVFASRGVDIPLFERTWASESPKLMAEYKRSDQGEAARKRLIRGITELVRAASDGGLTEIASAEVRSKQYSLLSIAQKERLRRIKEQCERAAPVDLGCDNPEAITYAVRKLFERRSVVKGWEILAEALNYSQGNKVDLSALKQDALARPELVFRDGEVTTAEHLKNEEEMIAGVTHGGGVALPKMSAEGLSRHQLSAVNSLLGSEEQFMVLWGKAGSGKTKSTSALIDANLGHGYRVVAVAPSTKSTQVIYDREQKPHDLATHTLQKFLVSQEIQAQLRPHDLLIVDEAGFASVEQLHKVLGAAKAGSWRVLFVGDIYQHVSVEAGDGLRVLLDRTKIKREWLEKIVRQTPFALNGRYLRAAKLFSIGETTKAFATLDRAGAIEVGRGPDRFTKIAKAYMADNDMGLSVISVNPSNRENDAVNQSVRLLLKERGALGEERLILAHRSLGWTLAEKEELGRLKPGMVLEITTGKDKGTPWIITQVAATQVKAVYQGVERIFCKANARMFEVCEQRPLPVAVGDTIITHCGMRKAGKEVANGTRVKIVGFSAMDDPIGENGEVISTRNITHGYASTSHKCQGDTVDSVIFGIDRFSVRWATRKLAYVAATRGRIAIRIFCENKADLCLLETRPGDRKSALELVKNMATKVAQESQKKRFAQERVTERV